jgi:hypothetical protein
MNASRLRFLILPIIAASLSGCASQILSPPARFQPFEGPRLAGDGATWLDLDGGGGGQMFGPSAFGGTLRARHGAGTREWSGEVSAVVLDDDAASTASRLWGALRGGVRDRIVDRFKHAWWGAGVGGGVYAGGVFVSPELGIGIGYDNPYIVPYWSITGIVSLPIVAREVDTTQEADTPRTDSPLASFGLRSQLGVEVPVTDSAALSLGINFVVLVDIEGISEGWAGFGGGLKFAL